jgi:hypothetical protein
MDLEELHQLLHAPSGPWLLGVVIIFVIGKLIIGG